MLSTSHILVCSQVCCPARKWVRWRFSRCTRLQPVWVAVAILCCSGVDTAAAVDLRVMLPQRLVTAAVSTYLRGVYRPCTCCQQGILLLLLLLQACSH